MVPSLQQLCLHRLARLTCPVEDVTFAELERLPERLALQLLLLLRQGLAVHRVGLAGWVQQRPPRELQLSGSPGIETERPG